jgi:hypothetical protein
VTGAGRITLEFPGSLWAGNLPGIVNANFLQRAVLATEKA